MPNKIERQVGYARSLSPLQNASAPDTPHASSIARCAHVKSTNTHRSLLTRMARLRVSWVRHLFQESCHNPGNNPPTRTELESDCLINVIQTQVGGVHTQMSRNTKTRLKENTSYTRIFAPGNRTRCGRLFTLNALHYCACANERTTWSESWNQTPNLAMLAKISALREEINRGTVCQTENCSTSSHRIPGNESDHKMN